MNAQWTQLLLAASLCTAVPASAQAPVGALAINERQGHQYGWAVDYETPGAARSTALARLHIQDRLRLHGFDPGTADRLFGPRTRAAIQSWQTSRGTQPTGYLDGAALDALRSAGPARGPVAATTTAPAVAATQPPSPTSQSPPPPVATAEQETLFWQSIMNSANPADFDAYLAQFPNGVFRVLAQNRLDMLRPTTTPGAAADTGFAGDASPTTAFSDFGDDTGLFAHDGECDDPRFQGAGMGLPAGTANHRGHDATDCRQLFQSGGVTLRPSVRSDPSEPIDFGNDTSHWAHDGECDDPRFQGVGMASTLLDADRGHDATDCRQLFESQLITLRPSNPADSVGSSIDFGDDSSLWANDGECDDTRFTGNPGYIGITSNNAHVRRDASDCRTLFNEGHIRLK